MLEIEIIDNVRYRDMEIWSSPRLRISRDVMMMALAGRWIMCDVFSFLALLFDVMADPPPPPAFLTGLELALLATRRTALVLAMIGWFLD